MTFESEPERLPTNPSTRSTGEGLTNDQRQRVITLLKDGVSVNEVVDQTGHSKHTVLAIRRAQEDANGLNLMNWKKATAATMAAIVAKGSTRLLEEIENIPAGQLPLALAILTDKVLALQDVPTVVVEHRLRVSHEDINKMLKGEADVIDLPPEPAGSPSTGPEPKE
jgi:IS30 family transposase